MAMRPPARGTRKLDMGLRDADLREWYGGPDWLYRQNGGTREGVELTELRAELEQLRGQLAALEGRWARGW